MRKTFSMAVLSMLVLTAAVFCFEKGSSMISNPFVPLEALTENTGEEGNLDPSVITCNSGEWGRCFKKIEWVDLFFLYRDCEWTGAQNDKCPWWWRGVFPIKL